MASLGDLDEAFQQAVDGFAQSLSAAVESLEVAPIEEALAGIDASPVSEALSSAAGDVGPAVQAAIDEGAGQADPQVVVENVDASAVGDAIEHELASVDTSGLDNLGESAAATGEEVQDLAAASAEAKEGVGLLGTGANVAAGNFGSLVGVLGKGAGAAGAAGTAVGLLASRAIKGQEAQERFNRTFGDFAGQIEAIDIGGLNTNLGDLAVQVGSSGGALRQAAANLGTIGQTSGVSARQVAETTEQFLALATQISATNPQLGSAEEVATRLVPALTGSARAGRQLGLGFNEAELATRAMQIAVADGRTEVTNFDKVAAGAAIRTEQLGNSLSTDIAEGSRSATVQMRSLEKQAGAALGALGKPLVIPLLGVVKELSAAVGVLTGEIPLLETSLLGLVAKGFTTPSTAASGLRVGLQGLVASLTENQAAIQANIEQTARLPGVHGDAARAVLEEQGAIRARREEQVAAAAADTAVIGQLQALGLSFDALKGKEVNLVALGQAQTEMATAFTQSIPTVSASLGQFAADTEINIKKVIADLTEQNNAFANFMPNLKAIIDKGGADLALSIQAMGPQQGAAFAQAVATATPTQIAALEAQTDRRNISINTSGEESGRLSAFAYERGATSSPALQASFQGGKRIGEQAVLGARDGGRGTDQVGRDIGSGLERGLKEKGPSLAATAWSIGQSIKKAFNSIFRNDSPSKVTMAIGRDVSEGLRLGMLQGSSGLGRAATSLGELALPAPRAVAGATPFPAQTAGVTATAGGGGIENLNVYTRSDEPQAIAFQVGTEILREASR